jgi:hypothetical protein
MSRMATPPPSLPDGYPQDLLDAVVRDAEADADRVVLFLDALGLTPPPGQTRPMPAAFLLDLGSALRLLAWEAHGFSFHRDAGLPAARDAIRAAFRGSPRDPAELSNAVLRLAVDRFAWAGQPELGTDVALGDVDEDAALDAIADFLWTHRHARSAP